MKKTAFVFLLSLSLNFLFSQEKVPLNHTIYEDWNALKAPTISNNGRYICYQVNPLSGDGKLLVKDLKSGSVLQIDRAYKASFSFDSRYLTSLQKPPFLLLREAKKAKKKKEETPGDSLVIIRLNDWHIESIADVESYKLSKEGLSVLAYKHYHRKAEDSLQSDTADARTQKTGQQKESDFINKHKLSDLVIKKLNKNESQKFENIRQYDLSENGALAGFEQMTGDSLINSLVYAFNTGTNRVQVISERKGYAEALSCCKNGNNIAFLSSPNQEKESGLELFLWRNGYPAAEMIIDSLGYGLPKGKGVSKHGKTGFSGDSQRLFFGIADLQAPEPKDTLLDEEKASLDVWSWTDPYIQPMQKIRLKKDEKRNYTAVYHITDKKIVPLADSLTESVISTPDSTNDLFFGFAEDNYRKQVQWEGLQTRDIYSVDVYTAKNTLLARKVNAKHEFSPDGKFLVYYSREDSAWISVETHSGKIFNLTNKLEVNFYQEDHDSPLLPASYGMAGFSDDKKSVFLYDKYDIWIINLKNEEEAVNYTRKYGRKNKRILRYRKTNKDEHYIKLNSPFYLSVIDENTNDEGYATIEKEKINLHYQGPYHFSEFAKAKDEDVFFFRKGNFREFDDLYISGPGFTDMKQISNANPQAELYLWGEVKAVKWLSFNGDSLRGMLYTPENLDTSRSYPMLVYFYEVSSHKIHWHRPPTPSRSIINPAWCTSNDYIVFVPDIKYREGYPGQSCYDAVVSGTQAMLERYSFINPEKIGLQGQSWGGYQIAWLITRTNLYAAAMAGAPVSNMTSAYGGVRWGSGMSRMFQYEKTQSRIGGTLWEKRDLYIENSPVFYAPNVKTPLLIMHNDKDGAVPWYQGIELFLALNRLRKPVWMLSYNDEDHNLTRLPNRIDLDIRMMQFFDHFLKDKAKPGWMKHGVPAIEKNKTNGRDLLKSETL